MKKLSSIVKSFLLQKLNTKIIYLISIFAIVFLIFQLAKPKNIQESFQRVTTHKTYEPRSADIKSPKPDAIGLRINQLIKKWEPYNTGSNKHIYTKEEREFARECVLELGCSDDLLYLINELDKQDPGVSKRIFDRVIRELLESNDVASKLRQDIVRIKENENIRERWSYLAGAGCSSSELEAFARHITNDADISAARLGNSIYVAKTDPIAALKMASNEIKSVSNNSLKQDVYTDIIKLSKNASLYPSIVSEIGQAAEVSKGHSDSLAADARRILFQQWTDINIDGAVSYFNQNPDDSIKEDVSEVFSRVALFKGYHAAFSLAQELVHPEQFDSAATAVIAYTCEDYPKESMELALQIKDAGIREKAVKQITETQKRLAADPSAAPQHGP